LESHGKPEKRLQVQWAKPWYLPAPNECVKIWPINFIIQVFLVRPSMVTRTQHDHDALKKNAGFLLMLKIEVIFDIICVLALSF
jgi:hypothetical protein